MKRNQKQQLERDTLVKDFVSYAIDYEVNIDGKKVKYKTPKQIQTKLNELATALSEL